MSRGDDTRSERGLGRRTASIRAETPVERRDKDAIERFTRSFERLLTQAAQANRSDLEQPEFTAFIDAAIALSTTVGHSSPAAADAARSLRENSNHLGQRYARPVDYIAFLYRNQQEWIADGCIADLSRVDPAMITHDDLRASFFHLDEHFQGPLMQFSRGYGGTRDEALLSLERSLGLAGRHVLPDGRIIGERVAGRAASVKYLDDSQRPTDERS